MKRSEYDFGNYTSFPSSLKLTSNETLVSWTRRLGLVEATPGSKIKFRINVKQKGVIEPRGGVVISGWDGKELRRLLRTNVPPGDFEWTVHEGELTLPEDIVGINTRLGGGGTTNPFEPAASWYDDFSIYQNGDLIYENYFSDWAPVLGAGAGAIIGGIAGGIYEPVGPIVSPLIGALGGAAIGGGIGYAISQQAISMPIATPLEKRYVITQV